ncbi:MAG TPA: hypothetical protein VN894_12945 [Polyangiaceae bacterium]|nr:hypothetical protein [Polyangiaceae bacterium]
MQTAHARLFPVPAGPPAEPEELEELEPPPEEPAPELPELAPLSTGSGAHPAGSSQHVASMHVAQVVGSMHEKPALPHDWPTSAIGHSPNAPRATCAAAGYAKAMATGAKVARMKGCFMDMSSLVLGLRASHAPGQYGIVEPQGRRGLSGAAAGSRSAHPGT